MLNIVGHLPQKYSDNILVTHNNHDMVYEVRGFQLHSLHLPSMQTNNDSKKIPTETNLVDIDYSPGISSLLCCSDKDVQIWDIRDNIPQPTIQSYKQFMNVPFTCCSISADGSLICCGTEVYRLKKKRRKYNSRNISEYDEETAQLVYWDTRNLSSPLGIIKDLHPDDIVDVKFDPTSVPGYLRLMDCSEDGVICLYDMNAEAISQDNSLLYMFNSESVASSCDWLISHNDLSSSSAAVGVYCTTTMRSNIKAWPIHPSMLHNNNMVEEENFKEDKESFSLSEKDEEELTEKTRLWNSKFNTNNPNSDDNDNKILKGKNFFNMILIQTNSSDEFLLLGDSNTNDNNNNNQNYPTVFHSNQSDWTMSYLPSNITMRKSQPINSSFNLQYADFIGKLTDNHSKDNTMKQLCFMVGSQSTVLCSYEISLST
ncbi:unnamed protein product [Schistosoma haematobium]|nr:unnamed protein product [Schistosoma haematobium]